MIHLPGATGPGPYDVALAWATAFASAYPEAAVTLSSVGSGAAQKALWGDIDCEAKPVDAVCAGYDLDTTVWGLGDAPISTNVYDDHPTLQLQQLPACAGAVSVVYTKEVLQESKEGPYLRMDWDILSGIFNTSIDYWDDPLIQGLNPSHRLPHEKISVVVREDSLGQTSIITDALYHNVPSWPEEAVGKSPDWPLETIVNPKDIVRTCQTVQNSTVSYESNGKNGVALGLLRVPYSIGYMEMGFLRRFTDFLTDVAIENPNFPGTFVSASEESLESTMGGLANQLDPDTLELNLAASDTPQAGYSISGYAYWYLKKNETSFSSCYQAWLVCKFVEWSYLNPQAAEIASRLGWAVPPSSVVNITLEQLNDVMCLDTEKDPPTVISAMSYKPSPYRTENDRQFGSITIAVTLVAVVIIFGSFILYCVQKRRFDADDTWKVSLEELSFSDPVEIIGRGSFGAVMLAEYRGTKVAVKKVIHHLPREEGLDSVGLVHGSSRQFSLGEGNSLTFGSWFRKGNRSSSSMDDKRFISEMRVMSKLRHPCITTVMGAVYEKRN